MAPPTRPTPTCAGGSSRSCWGRSTETTPTRPVEIYGRAKLAAEEYVKQAGSEGLITSIVRPRTIVGHGRLGIFKILFEWIKDGAAVFVIGSGDQLFQFVHVDDVADLSIACVLSEKPGIYLAGSSAFGSLRQDLEELIRHAGSKSRVVGLPVWPSIASLYTLDKLRLSPLGPWHYLTYHKSFYFDLSQTEARLGWKPLYSNRDLLVEGYDWFIKHHAEATSATGSFHRTPTPERFLKVLKRLSMRT